ncbi:MAG: phosphate ABC transporter permease subunit PstC [Clostridia bacterium]|nr:phosphate ABC transporter permease subunit PstC [Clostridia bacterium]
MVKSENKSEKAAKIVFITAACFSIVAVFAIVLFIFASAFPALQEIGTFKFLFGSKWFPKQDEYGLLPMIVATLLVTVSALLIGGAFGIFTAIFVVYFCPKKLKGFFNQIIVLLAGIPSIIYGFFGMIVLSPALKSLFNAESGNGLLASALILGLMILPTVTSLTKNALESVPRSYSEGSLALGASREQTIFRIDLPAAKTGVLSALTLGAGRAIGETMAVLVVCGNSAAFPDGLFSPIRPLTVNIVNEMGYAMGLHRQALFATGLVLLVFIFLLNGFLAFIKREKKEKDEANRTLVGGGAGEYIYKVRGMGSKILSVVSCLIAAVVVLVLGILIGYILVNGLPEISLDFLFGKPTYKTPTLLGAFVSTGWIILLSLLIAIPLGVGAAIFLVEYTKPGSKLVKVIRVFIDTLSGIPSIVFGLFGMIAFCAGGKSLFAGALTLSLMILPTVIRSVEESLLAVQNSVREGSLALGATKVRTIFKVVLPSALSGVVTAIILSVGRIVSESAALIFTAGSLPMVPSSPLDSGSTFAVLMYNFTAENPNMEAAYATATVLLMLVFLVNLAAYFCEKKWKKNK